MDAAGGEARDRTSDTSFTPEAAEHREYGNEQTPKRDHHRGGVTSDQIVTPRTTLLCGHQSRTSVATASAPGCRLILRPQQHRGTDHRRSFRSDEPRQRRVDRYSLRSCLHRILHFPARVLVIQAARAANGSDPHPGHGSAHLLVRRAVPGLGDCGSPTQTLALDRARARLDGTANGARHRQA